jgi:hypothetical protein
MPTPLTISLQKTIQLIVIESIFLMALFLLKLKGNNKLDFFKLYIQEVFMNKLFLLSAAIAALAVGNSSASFINVTSNDLHTGWDTSEDEEIDAGNFVQSEEVEAFMWDANSKTLSLVGGYDFVNGYYSNMFSASDPRSHVVSGDIFIDLANNGSFDLAFDLDFAANTYTVYEVSATNVVNVDAAWNHSFSNPFEINGGNVLGTGVLGYNTYTSDVYGLAGGFHNEVVLYNIGAFGIINNFGAHYTMSCGNDLITASVPEPTILTLLGLGFFGAALVGRKRRQ